jgi:hypothetical protein
MKTSSCEIVILYMDRLGSTYVYILKGWVNVPVE